jgi:hypothetical protein
MFQSQKNVFWEALLITILIFALGVVAGFFLENVRNSEIDSIYKASEISLLDARTQSEIYKSDILNCSSAVEENINFANRIYEEAKTLERYQKSTVLTRDILLSHQKYDLLRVILFMNSLEIKKKCNTSYSDVVYFYKSNDKNLDIIAKEGVFSKILSELKEKKGNNILLIPIAVDSNLSSTKLFLDKYNINEKELPVILIDEKIIIKNLESVKELEKYFN